MARVGPNRIQYTEIQRILIRYIYGSVNKISPPYLYPYDRTWAVADRIYMTYIRSKPYMHHIWTVFAGGAGTQVRLTATAVFLLFLVSFFPLASK